MKIRREDALNYHAGKRAGKLEVIPTKPCLTQLDLSLAYTPGVAVPCLEIQKDPQLAYSYTGRGNLVAVISNGTAVLGLGNIGALAGKPVMEGKAVLFKRFADIDVFDIEIDTLDPDEFIRAVVLLEPTFGGINLEDIKAPDCFYIEQELKKRMNIPIFHDDQHGTAIITGAAFLNALELADKRPEEVRIVFNGAGASGIACAEILVLLGARRSNITMLDSKGVLHKGRQEGMNAYKEKFALDTPMRTLADAMKDADVFIGLSQKDQVTPEMLLSMAPNPIVFAMANPDPEIDYDLAMSTRADLIMGTGRSDFPNQINNVLGFPFIFRGALDVRARQINEEMKLAAARSLAALAQEDVPELVKKAYGNQDFRFGREYFLPKPFDPRVLLWEAPAVAQAAVDTGVAGISGFDIEQYRDSLERHLGRKHEVMRTVIQKAVSLKHRIAFIEGEEDKVIKAAEALRRQHVATPVLLGNRERIHRRAEELRIDGHSFEIVDPTEYPENQQQFAQELFQLRKRKGLTVRQSREIVKTPEMFGLMMLRNHMVDGIISGVSGDYPEKLRLAMQVVGLRQDVHRICGLIIVLLRDKLLFCADTSVNFDPTAEELADITILSAEVAGYFGIDPRIALLSFSNFGAVRNAQTDKVRKTVDIVRLLRPDLVVDGEMQVGTALNEELARGNFPQSEITGNANVLIFPELNSGNIGYKLLQNLGSADVIGPIHLGFRQPVNVVDHTATVSDVVHMAAITAVMTEFSRRAEKPAAAPASVKAK
jgi:malate dehydrogenase (oxaloacetate-decarboxylating)(NADP+)